MSDRSWRMKPTLVSYLYYVESLIKPYFLTNEFKTYDFKGKIELKQLESENVVAIYVDNEEDFDLAISVVDKTFQEEKNKISVRFFEKTLINKN